MIKLIYRFTKAIYSQCDTIGDKTEAKIFIDRLNPIR